MGIGRYELTEVQWHRIEPLHLDVRVRWIVLLSR
jgi:hypothetical protein